MRLHNSYICCPRPGLALQFSHWFTFGPWKEICTMDIRKLQEKYFNSSSTGSMKTHKTCHAYFCSEKGNWWETRLALIYSRRMRWWRARNALFLRSTCCELDSKKSVRTKKFIHVYMLQYIPPSPVLGIRKFIFAHVIPPNGSSCSRNSLPKMRQSTKRMAAVLRSKKFEYY